jgi:glycosyltransferase involved in cell wall biosynthesis
MRVSIITVVRNNQATIAHAINSVLKQDYPNVEYIVIDGSSSDATPEIIKSYGSAVNRFISEPDKGMYDAMNKGLKLATGEIIGFLNSDDFYEHKSVISQIVWEFSHRKVDLVFGDIVFVHPQDTEQIIRYYSSANFSPELFSWGWMPAHPSCFVKRKIYEKYGDFKTEYQLASDYELLLRLIKIHQISYSYLDNVLVRMRLGGASNRNLKCRWISNQEVIQACREHGVSTNFFKLLARYPVKILEKILVASKYKSNQTRTIPVLEVKKANRQKPVIASSVQSLESQGFESRR